MKVYNLGLAGMIAILASTSLAATPEQVGTYVGTATYTSYDLSTGAKAKQTIPTTFVVEANNTVTFLGRVQADCPISPKNGGFHQFEGIGAFFKFSKTSVSGTFTFVNTNVLETGTFKVKKQ